MWYEMKTSVKEEREEEEEEEKKEVNHNCQQYKKELERDRASIRDKKWDYASCPGRYSRDSLKAHVFCSRRSQRGFIWLETSLTVNQLTSSVRFARDDRERDGVRWTGL